jgi:hypothetical protein
MVTQIRKMWTDSAPLTATCLFMLVVFIASLAGIFLDLRIITGVPAWLKPAKFAISTAIFTGTMAWLFRYIQVWPRFTRAMGWILAASLILEVGIIDIQAARGTTSHFNVATPLDQALFIVMGTVIGALWLASIGVLVALCRQQFENRAWGWALRLGALIMVLGSAAGGLMLRTTPEESAARQMHQSVTANGGHTVGAADGGPGITGLGWSTHHGDLRVPHFFGLHAIQVVPFLSWFVIRRRRRGELALVFTISAGYLGLIAILMWQALRGQSILEPDAWTLAAFAAWLIATAAGAFLSTNNYRISRLAQERI